MNNHHFEFTEYSDNKERPLNKISLTSSVLKYGEEQQSPDFFDIIIVKRSLKIRRTLRVTHPITASTAL